MDIFPLNGSAEGAAEPQAAPEPPADVPHNGDKNDAAGLEQSLAESLTSAAARKESVRGGEALAAEHELKALREELTRRDLALAQVCNELELFAFAVSHDLKAPLRHVIGFSEALAQQLGENLDPTAQTYLDCIVRAGRKMDGMLDALLKLSRIGRQEMKMAEVDLSALARGCAASLQGLFPERKVRLNVAEHLSVRGDQTLLAVALEHIFDNAWKFTAKKVEANVEFGCTVEAGETVYYLRDDGVGFDMQYAEKLFAPFQRMHSETEFEGRGIGLAAVQRIIHRHGGKVWVDARLDQGATIYFTIPRSADVC